MCSQQEVHIDHLHDLQLQRKETNSKGVTKEEKCDLQMGNGPPKNKLLNW